jgi:AcrR family transcriptional regulator
VAAAWEEAREHGLATLTLRRLAARIGMSAPSLYTHFSAKHAIYDAMFADAWREVEQIQQAMVLPAEPRAALRTVARTFFDFSTADLPRHQLMDSRIIPDFTPTPEAYAPAVRVMAALHRLFATIFGTARDEDVDLFSALVGGLIDAQWANDPGGQRYARLLDRAIDMFADDMGLPPEPTAEAPARSADRPGRPEMRDTR